MCFNTCVMDEWKEFRVITELIVIDNEQATVRLVLMIT